MTNRDEVCDLLDKLTLEVLDLIEQDVQCKINIEKITNEGQLMMAKSRYIQGQNSVSACQLPTENSLDFHALASVHSENESLKIERHKIDKNAGFVDPIKWFGILVPLSLYQAKENFTKALDFVVESANIRYKLNSYYGHIINLRKSKIDTINVIE